VLLSNIEMHQAMFGLVVQVQQIQACSKAIIQFFSSCHAVTENWADGFCDTGILWKFSPNWLCSKGVVFFWPGNGEAI
jgi:hypothetical protein